jgi:hypothetical protein
MREKAAVCLGNLCVGDKKFPFTEKVISGMMDSAAVIKKVNQNNFNYQYW